MIVLNLFALIIGVILFALPPAGIFFLIYKAKKTDNPLWGIFLSFAILPFVGWLLLAYYFVSSFIYGLSH